MDTISILIMSIKSQDRLTAMATRGIQVSCIHYFIQLEPGVVPVHAVDQEPYFDQVPPQNNRCNSTPYAQLHHGWLRRADRQGKSCQSPCTSIDIAKIHQLWLLV
jgi:hypothetical protein